MSLCPDARRSQGDFAWPGPAGAKLADGRRGRAGKLAERPRQADFGEEWTRLVDWPGRSNGRTATPARGSAPAWRACGGSGQWRPAGARPGRRSVRAGAGFRTDARSGTHRGAGAGSRRSRAALSEISGYAPSESFFSTPPARRNFNRHNLPPDCVTWRSRPFSSATLWDLARGLSARIAESVSDTVGAFRFRPFLKAPTKAPESTRLWGNKGGRWRTGQPNLHHDLRDFSTSPGRWPTG